MLTRSHNASELFRRKMQDHVTLTDDDLSALAALPIRILDLEEDQDVVRQADRTSQSCLLVQGFACSSKLQGDGKRQIVAIHLPGDMPDLQCVHLGIADATITTMIPSKVGIILHEHLRELFGSRRLTTGLWRTLVADALISREWVANLGHRQALPRMAHLLSELSTRMHQTGAMQGESFDLPMTQLELGDSLGLSTVHINRCLQSLRRRKLIAWAGTKLTILDREALAEVGDFTDDYLHSKPIH